ncbi:hydroxyproline dehydrogenase-like isoform X1 [Eriocheir sinensis]|uniref:hydroxyproline dehydrogenase-like isoform X1 n=1 Tax=Eriocheir sinensis TaxID=95602 RepID=UPI0021C6A3BC|nr:hydroxyproline dehydrogenase-like isoform X1 [Eriocheir sinensis]
MRQTAVRLLLSHRGLLREPPRASSLTFLCQTHALSALSPSTCQASTHTDARTKAQPHAQINVQSPTNQLDFGDGSWVFRHKTARELLRGLLVLHACAVDPLVTHSYKLMKIGERLLGSSLLGLLMSPFYSQFVAGDSEAELGRVSRSLADVGVRLMVAPMLETDLGEGVDEQEMYRRNLDKTLMLVAQTRRQSVMGGARPVCQTKMTAHLTADVLKRVSDAYQSLTLEGKTEAVRELGQLMVKEATKEEGEAGGKKREAGREEWPHPSTSSVSSSSSSLQGLLRSLPLQESDAHRLLCCLPRLHQLGETCRREDVVLAVDAEYTYTNPAINLMTLAMMHVFNRQEKRGGGGRGRGPIVWNTYQGYLKAGVENLQEDLAVARALGEDMSFGVKLVRGAYLERERAWAAEQGRPDPVNDTYEDTCDVYNRMVEVMLAEVDAAENASGGGEGAEGGQVSRAVMVATHNEESVVLATQKATRLGLDTRGGSVVFAQVYGMAENISVPLAAAGFLVYKSVPVGSVAEVLPYLSRRAAENRAVMRGARRERQLLAKELAARVVGRG